ncbi:transcriptional regulator [Corynebacterium maris DSM 45190]|uniref:Transcriptional regulator n=1 Tax=Corynebacterium maris DSM 45190 TaxID=1224163 RepID=S5TLV7_9CORY|nr:MerR family transcriptional regulator [Corynebacterium maris]AGS35678.1 transcriptional regulator [Corynebacterium maris DSM 45190]
MTDYSIGEAAEILNVTTRTLRHWDQVGLLVPGWRTWADHRLYTDADMERALQILVYREAGLRLGEIGELIDAPGTAAEKLRRQRGVLVDKIGQLHRMIRAVDELLQEGKDMDINDKISHFEEARRRWGDTPEWAQSQEASANMGADEVTKVRRGQEEFVDRLVDAAEGGVAPGSAEAAELVAAHRESISGWYEVTMSRQVILARMYVGDERFDAAYREQSRYLLALVEGQARREGVDLDDVQWG